jgi:hypothetical protein
MSDAIRGTPAVFYIQTKDSLGNNKTTDFEDVAPSDLLKVTVKGVVDNLNSIYYADLEYEGDGLFKATYTPLRTGKFEVNVQMGGDFDSGLHIYCGNGEAEKCSPFDLTIVPGPTVPMYSEVESPSIEAMDYLVEAVAGEYGYFYIQAKDAFGNNQITGGDDFEVKFVNTADSSIEYRGNVDDHLDGTYTVRYTIRVAGTYTVYTTLATSATGEDEDLLQCVASTSPYIFDRFYDGKTPYVTPGTCAQTKNTLTVVHNDLYAPTSTPLDTGTELVTAIVGETNYFYVQARDEFGNLREGDSTSNFAGYGNGESDYFLVDFTQTESGDHHQVSTAVDTVNATYLASDTDQYFKLSFGGKTTEYIPVGTSATGMEAILESLHDYQLDVVVTKTTSGVSHVSSLWKVTFLTMLDVWQSMPPSGVATGTQLSVADGSANVQVVRSAYNGLYPVDFTLWHTGSYLVSITNNGVDISSSPFTLTVINNGVDATASIASGEGLTGGVAGEPISVTIAAKDKRQKTVQYIVSEAELVPYAKAVQVISFKANGPLTIGFRGMDSTSSITVGTSTFNDLVAALNTLTTLDMSGADDTSFISGGGFTCTDTAASDDIKPMTFDGTARLCADVIAHDDIVEISFMNTDLNGPLPQFYLSDTGLGTVATTYAGDAPYRAEAQVLTCTDNTETLTFTLDGVSSSALIGTTTAANLAADLNTEWASLKYGSVSVYGLETASSGLTICSASDSLLIVFEEYMGPVPDITVTDTSTSGVSSISQSEDDGALAGISPVYGEWSLGIHGENTTSLAFDATSTEVESALEALYSVGDVTVSKDGYGLGVDASGSVLSPVRYQFYVWAITFSADCTGNVGNSGVAQGYCPASLGDEPVFYVNTDSLDFVSSPHSHQARPTVQAVKSLTGYAGNTRNDHADLPLMAVELTHRTISSPQVPEVGMYEKQTLYCNAQSDGRGETFFFQLMKDTV